MFSLTWIDRRAQCNIIGDHASVMAAYDALRFKQMECLRSGIGHFRVIDLSTGAELDPDSNLTELAGKREGESAPAEGG